MDTTHEIEPGRRIDLSAEVIGIDGSRRTARIVEQERGRPPTRIDGLTIGAPVLTGDSPHGGEMHPDGDELLYLVSGAISVRLELAGGDRAVELAASDAMVVPKGVWHRIILREAGTLLHITPGPHGDSRRLASASDWAVG